MQLLTVALPSARTVAYTQMLEVEATIKQLDPPECARAAHDALLVFTQSALDAALVLITDPDTGNEMLAEAVNDLEAFGQLLQEFRTVAGMQ